MPPRFVKQQYLWNIAIQPAVGCYNSWANSWCSGWSPRGEKLLWNRFIESYADNKVHMHQLTSAIQVVLNVICNYHSLNQLNTSPHHFREGLIRTSQWPPIVMDFNPPKCSCQTPWYNCTPKTCLHIIVVESRFLFCSTYIIHMLFSV